MPVSFNRIPSNLRVPLFWAEFDATQAGYLAQPQPACLLGHKLDAAPATENVPILVSSADQAAALFGLGSMLHNMVDTYRLNDPTGELWCVAVPEPVGTPPTTTVTFTGPSTAGGTVAVYIGGRRYAVSVAVGATAASLATALAAAITADPLAPCTAAAAVDVTTLTARHPGTVTNSLAIALNLRGITAGEFTPAGVTVVALPFSAGTGDPDLAPALAALGDAEYDYVGFPWTDTANLDDVRDAFGEVSGRWAWDRQLYGHAFTAKPGTPQALSTAGKTRNDPHCSILGVPAATQSPPWTIAAAFTAEAAVGLRADPARPLQTLPLLGVMYAPRGARFTVADRQTLLYSGVATAMCGVDDLVHIERAITTYQKNAWGQIDPSYLDVQTPATLQYIVRALRSAILIKFPRHKLANDGTRFGAGQAIVTPGIIKDELIAQYRTLESQGLCENMEAFKKFLIVERDITDPNRCNVLLPPDLVNQLRVLAMLVQFRLQFSPQATASAA
jgi:phage tail sheath gpL-like